MNIKKFIKALDYDRDSGVRCEAIVALGKIGDESAIQPIVNILVQSRDSFIKLSDRVSIPYIDMIIKKEREENTYGETLENPSMNLSGRWWSDLTQEEREYDIAYN